MPLFELLAIPQFIPQFCGIEKRAKAIGADFFQSAKLKGGKA
jgi:hypothetical protein